jgi:hypothetical protein
MTEKLTWTEQRELLEAMTGAIVRVAGPCAFTDAIAAMLARLDAAEDVVGLMQDAERDGAIVDRPDVLGAYERLVSEQG